MTAATASAAPLPNAARAQEPFNPVPLPDLITHLERNHEAKREEARRLVGAGKLDARYAALCNFRRRSVLHYLRQLLAQQEANP